MAYSGAVKRNGRVWYSGVKFSSVGISRECFAPVCVDIGFEKLDGADMRHSDDGCLVLYCFAGAAGEEEERKAADVCFAFQRTKCLMDQ